MDQKVAEASRQRVGSFALNTTQEDGPVCRPFHGVRLGALTLSTGRGLTGSL